MAGYIYRTTNLINNKVYIGKHEKSEYDSSYYGSGKILQQAIQKYGIENFSNEILFECDTIEELNSLEISTIKEYKEKYGKDCYNIAFGGDGGNVWRYSDEEDREDFRERMTLINQERCRSETFKEKTSKRMSEKYMDEKERQKQSERICEAWSNPELRKQQSDRVTEWYKTHSIDHSCNFKSCYIKINSNILTFSSLKECEEYLKTTYGFIPNRLTKYGKDNPYKPYHNKYKILDGLIFEFCTNKSVETMGDECNPVGAEIDTASKCKAMK